MCWTIGFNCTCQVGFNLIQRHWIIIAELYTDSRRAVALGTFGSYPDYLTSNKNFLWLIH